MKILFFIDSLNAGGKERRLTELMKALVIKQDIEFELVVMSNVIHYKEVSVYGAFASYKKQYEKALSLIAEKKIQANKFITDTYPLKDIVMAFESSKKGGGLKTVVTME